MYNVAIIGAGIGAQHGDAYAALPDRFRVRTVCDLDAARAATLAEPHGAEVVTSLDAVLADPVIDVIDICLPPHLHASTTLGALKSGKHVICEKPLANSLADVDALIATAQQTGKQVFPVFQYRYGLGTAQVRALIDAGLAGRCYAATLETHWNRGADYYAVPWRGTWAGEHGGAILGHAIHIHDLLTMLLGPVARVYARLATRVNPIETEDCAALTLTMESGALVTSSVTLGAADDHSRLRMMFEGFTVESDHAPYAPAERGWTFTARAPVEQSQLDDVLRGIADQPAGFAGFLTSVADALDGRPADAVTLAEGRRSIEFVTAVYQSARSDCAVDVPLASPHPLYAGWQPAPDAR